jgi:hypothetical protein
MLIGLGFKLLINLLINSLKNGDFDTGSGVLNFSLKYACVSNKVDDRRPTLVTNNILSQNDH